MHFQTDEEEEEKEEAVKKRVCEPGRPGLAGDSCLPGPARRGLRLLTWSALLLLLPSVLEIGLA